MSYGDVTTSSSIMVRATAGGVQELIAIERSDAPNEFAFPLALPTGAVLVAADDGSAAIVDSSGHEVAAIAAPWAKDAAGRAVPTSYRLDGSTLIQVVEHEGATYPVVADPSFTWGIRRGLTRSRTKAARGREDAPGPLGVGCQTLRSHLERDDARASRPGHRRRCRLCAYRALRSPPS